MQLARKLVKEKRGQALVELAIVLPLLILLLMGTIEFGRIFHSYLLITNASREGARVAITGANNNTIETRINEVTSSLGQKQIIIEPANENLRKSTVPVTITVKYNVSLITPVLDMLVPNPIPLTASTSMRIE